MMTTFLLKSSNPASSLVFSDKSLSSFSVTVDMPSIRATKVVRLYDLESSDWLPAFFLQLASYEMPWAGEQVWSSHDHKIDLAATCSALGQVEFNIVLRDIGMSNDPWSAKCTIAFEFGMLNLWAKNAGLFFDS